MGRKPRRPGNLTLDPVTAYARRGPREGRWYWQAVRREGGMQITVWTGWATREEARQQIATLVASNDLERTPRRAPEGLHTFRALLEFWIGAQEGREDLSPYTLRGYTYAARNLISVLGDVQPVAVNFATLARYRDQRLRSGGSTGSVAMELGVLGIAWRWGREVGICPARDLPKVHLRVKPTYNQRTPSIDDVIAVLQHLDGWRRLAVLVLFATGARVGEVASLQWADVNLGAGELLLDGKTGVRNVPIAPEVVDELRRWASTGPTEGYLFRVRPKTLMGGLRSKHLPRACEAAGVLRFTPHGLRRAAVEAMLDAGVDPKTAASVTGHSVKTMLEYYRRPTMESRRNAILRAGLGVVQSRNVIPFRA